ncbi:MAG: NifU family protein [Deltaproteobacteria bacterium]|nr:NifU family protein [Myxococcales bacterium]MDP3218414.1 NifU family protein [Deltaproteobacteria bacterium]
MTAPATIECQRALRALVESVLAPLVAKDGGVLRWRGRVDDVVEVSLGGACLGCPAQRDTLDSVLLPAMRAVDPSVAAVRVVAPT